MMKKAPSIDVFAAIIIPYFFTLIIFWTQHHIGLISIFVLNLSLCKSFLWIACKWDDGGILSFDGTLSYHKSVRYPRDHDIPSSWSWTSHDRLPFCFGWSWTCYDQLPFWALRFDAPGAGILCGPTLYAPWGISFAILLSFPTIVSNPKLSLDILFPFPYCSKAILVFLSIRKIMSKFASIP